MSCLKHPKYKGIKKPRIKCNMCKLIFLRKKIFLELIERINND